MKGASMIKAMQQLAAGAVLPAFMEGFRYAFLTAAALCVVGAVISALSENNRSKPGRA